MMASVNLNVHVGGRYLKNLLSSPHRASETAGGPSAVPLPSGTRVGSSLRSQQAPINAWGAPQSLLWHGCPTASAVG